MRKADINGIRFTFADISTQLSIRLFIRYSRRNSEMLSRSYSPDEEGMQIVEWVSDTIYDKCAKCVTFGPHRISDLI